MQGITDGESARATNDRSSGPSNVDGYGNMSPCDPHAVLTGRGIFVSVDRRTTWWCTGNGPQAVLPHGRDRH